MHHRLPSEPRWEPLPPPDPFAHKKIEPLDIISHKRGFEAPSVTRHVPQSALAPDSWRGLLEDQNDFTLPPTDQGLPKVLDAGRGVFRPIPAMPWTRRVGDGPEDGPMHRQ